MTELLEPEVAPRAASVAEPSDRVLRSCIYRGWVRHRRYRPREHAFGYRLFLMYLDLDEIESLFDGRWFWSVRRWAPARFRRSDYLAPHELPLKRAVLDLVERETGRRPEGPVRMLTHLRYWGYSFNPVTFYYCFDAAGSLDTVVAEITNTPWRQRHAYVLGPDENVGDRGTHRFRFRKEFHVSPFLDMDQDYDWRFSTPGEDLLVHMENRRAGERTLDATLVLRRRELNGFELAKSLFLHPFMTGKVILAIHWNALRLWLKRVPFHAHPDQRDESPGSKT